LALRKSFF